jgi:hypothetical protein
VVEVVAGRVVCTGVTGTVGEKNVGGGAAVCGGSDTDLVGGGVGAGRRRAGTVAVVGVVVRGMLEVVLVVGVIVDVVRVVDVTVDAVAVVGVTVDVVRGRVRCAVVAAAAWLRWVAGVPARELKQTAIPTAVRPRVTTLAARWRTRPVWRFGVPEEGHSHWVGGGMGGSWIRSPGKSRFGLAGAGRLGRLTSTTCHQ